MKKFKTANPSQTIEQSKFACFCNNTLSHSQSHNVKGGEDTEPPIENPPPPPIIIEDIVDI